MRQVRWSILIAMGLGLAGCGPYAAKHHYLPQPGHVAFDASATEQRPDARAVVTVIGILRSLPDEPKRKGVELRLRLENLSEQPIRFDPGQSVLLDAALSALPGPIEAPKPVTLERGQERAVTLVYRLPESTASRGDALKGLNLRLTLDVSGNPITRSITFHRREPYSHRGYHHPGYHGGYHRSRIGVGIRAHGGF